MGYAYTDISGTSFHEEDTRTQRRPRRYGWFASARRVGHRPRTVKRVAGQLGYGTESVRAWVLQADIDDGGGRERRLGT